MGAIALALRIPFTSEALRKRVVETLSDRLDAEVELGDLTLRVLPALHAEGTDLRIRHKGRRDVPPLISIDKFTVDANLLGLWRYHVAHVNLEGSTFRFRRPTMLLTTIARTTRAWRTVTITQTMETRPSVRS